MVTTLMKTLANGLSTNHKAEKNVNNIKKPF